jgi:hypothetical protein
VEVGNRATAVSDFLKEVFTSVHPDKAQGRRVTVEEVLDQAARRLDDGRALPAQPSVEAAVRLVLGSAYLGIARPREAKCRLSRSLVIRDGWIPQYLGGGSPEMVG